MVTAMKNFLKFKTGESPDVRKFGEEYYLREAKIWRPFRIGGVFSIAIALPLALASILHDNWMYGDGKCSLLFRVKSFNYDLSFLTRSFCPFLKLAIDIRSIFHVQMINNLVYNVYNCIVNGGGGKIRNLGVSMISKFPIFFFQ